MRRHTYHETRLDEPRRRQPQKLKPRCVVCGCTDETPCIDQPYGTCWWTYVDERSAAGLCSKCARLPLAELERCVQFSFAGQI